MAVKLRLTRVGKTKQPQYRIVAADSRSPRDGRFIEILGTTTRARAVGVSVDNDKAVKWLVEGAQPTERVRKLLEISGAWRSSTPPQPSERHDASQRDPVGRPRPLRLQCSPHRPFHRRRSRRRARRADALRSQRVKPRGAGRPRRPRSGHRPSWPHRAEHPHRGPRRGRQATASRSTSILRRLNVVDSEHRRAPPPDGLLEVGRIGRATRRARRRLRRTSRPTATSASRPARACGRGAVADRHVVEATGPQRWLVRFEGVDRPQRRRAADSAALLRRADRRSGRAVGPRPDRRRVVDADGTTVARASRCSTTRPHDILELDIGPSCRSRSWSGCDDGVVTIDPPDGLFESTRSTRADRRVHASSRAWSTRSAPRACSARRRAPGCSTCGCHDLREHTTDVHRTRRRLAVRRRSRDGHAPRADVRIGRGRRAAAPAVPARPGRSPIRPGDGRRAGGGRRLQPALRSLRRCRSPCARAPRRRRAERRRRVLSGARWPPAW